MRLRLITSLVFVFAAMLAQAQTTLLSPVVGQSNNTTVLPLLSNENGQIEGLLLIEPSLLPPQLPSQRIIGPAPARNLLRGNGFQLRAGLTMEDNPGVGVLCNNSDVVTTVSALAGNCLLVNFAGSPNILPGSRTVTQGHLQLQRSNVQLTASVGTQRDTLGNPNDLLGNTPADLRVLNTLLGPGSASVSQRNASLVSQITLGDQGWISIGGALAHARLIPTAQLPGGLPAEWNTGSLNLSAGVKNFGGEITGQMIEVPGQASRYGVLGAGVTWRTPWRAKLSVGADNLVTRGKNPFSLPDAGNNNTDEGRVPYVRYQQDL